MISESSLIIDVIAYIALIVICSCGVYFIGKIHKLLCSGILAIQKGNEVIAVFIGDGKQLVEKESNES